MHTKCLAQRLSYKCSIHGIDNDGEEAEEHDDLGADRTMFFIFFFFNVYLLILREERQSSDRGGTERGRESQAGTALSVQSPTWGSTKGATKL